jgi:hypothetical protein
MSELCKHRISEGRRCIDCIEADRDKWRTLAEKAREALKKSQSALRFGFDNVVQASNMMDEIGVVLALFDAKEKSLRCSMICTIKSK